MPILLALAGLILLAIVFGPQVWVRRVLAQHGLDRPDLPGTGGELARHLLDEAGLQQVQVERTDLGDHYDPEARVVRLLPQHHDGRSVAAAAVAAHEVSHAVQHARGEPAFAPPLRAGQEADLGRARGERSPAAGAGRVHRRQGADRAGAAGRSAACCCSLIRIVVHVATLPVEFDASFGKALPVLEQGRYLSAADLPAARNVLRAAAWTYVAVGARHAARCRALVSDAEILRPGPA